VAKLVSEYSYAIDRPYGSLVDRGGYRTGTLLTPEGVVDVYETIAIEGDEQILSLSTARDGRSYHSLQLRTPRDFITSTTGIKTVARRWLRSLDG
jgi:hypothetical protein